MGTAPRGPGGLPPGPWGSPALAAGLIDALGGVGTFPS